MTKRRFNIWLDEPVIKRVKAAAKRGGIKASTFMRMAILEKLNHRRPTDEERNQDT